MATIDVDELRNYMKNYCGTAAFSGFPAAILDVIDVGRMNARELCEKAESMGVDLRRFEIR